MTKQKRITQADRLVVYVSQHPGITTPEVCDAFNTDSGSTGQQLAALVQRGVMTRSHNGTHWEYTVVPGSDIPISSCLNSVKKPIRKFSAWRLKKLL
jgi:predicted HTH transcriptional regulator